MSIHGDPSSHFSRSARAHRVTTVDANEQPDPPHSERFATADRANNAAYIHLRDVERGGAAHQHLVDEPYVMGTIVLDFDLEGRLLGIEVLNAVQALPDEVMNAALREQS
jgi:uncharacterized protein YuzE